MSDSNHGDARREEMMAGAGKKPKGLLSLMYWVKNDARIRARFHEDMLATMESQFGIPRGSAVATEVVKVAKVSTSPADYERALKALCQKLLVEELVSPTPPIW
ncbi:hypothetical protein [Sorangium atrum]|uniref:Uncharacterized protein n=1 Tax=Sorangium atrum TaxID=2995308 RepID=A0ABT5CCJ5_9BACT|nr:hypothetical protein [Sorangium aterium]MDC0683504.1 hypothetical protein [Sorangium aterium]